MIRLMRRLARIFRTRTGRVVLSIILTGLIGLLVLMLVLVLKPLNEDDLRARYPESRRIFDSQGRLLREVVNRNGARARWTGIDEISPLAVEATIAVEDARFCSHSGIDVLAVVRAAWHNARAGRVVSGASTITMQLSRMLYAHSHDMTGKLAQAFDALRIERAIDKKTILEQYLNRAPYGAGTVGIEAASQRYFGKPSMHLSLAEAALLAGLPKSPTDLNPLDNLPAARRRQRLVLGRMLETGRIGSGDYERALEEPIQFRRNPPRLAAMHFTDYVLIKDNQVGDVFTELDGDLQGQIERLVADHVGSLRLGGLTNAAVVVLDNEECTILAMVGSADYWDGKSGSVNGATSRRQPGSTLKPFIYALAFERGHTPASIVADIETQYLGHDSMLYMPRNYSEQYTGPVLMGEALGRSLNVPAIRTANALGVGDLLERLRQVGFSSLDRNADHYGLGLTLGNGEVTLLELAQGYAMFARGGLACRARVLAKSPAEKPRRVYSEAVSFLITDILGDESLRIRAFGAANPLLLGFPIAIKTGTSTNWRDNWVVGYTKRHTVAVWAGDFEGGTMNHLSGSIGAGPLFHKIARLLVQHGAIPEIPIRPEPPEGVKQIAVCPLSGMSPTKHCPHRRSVHVIREDQPRPPCDLHRVLHVDKRNGLLASDRCPRAFIEERVFEVLPAGYAEWQASHSSLRPPTHYSPYCPAEGITANALVITNPRQGEVYLLEPGYDRTTQTIQLSGEVDPALPKVTWLVDGHKLTTVSWPYGTNWRMSRGRHRLEMLGGGMRSDPIEFDVR